ncbi:hypothetical protein BD289DRAFT_457564 [Coniella lustricola]|uniref:Molybdate-anion transporter n=1 Tax=Coniella lustricola TaxID=2025994 RepID=A0A2T3ANN4_9PEZI|nr:hypothetical protein BD289DRAFT_457564 [Coniella lustricola]
MSPTYHMPPMSFRQSIVQWVTSLGNAVGTSFRRTFLTIYLLVMSSEWLSGPYLYTLFRDDYAFSESTVCALYATAYTSAAVSALATGFLADRYGRRKACLAQCLVHSAACLTVVFGGRNLPILFLGRVLAGTALTLLWTVFEGWMVTEWNARGLDECNETGTGNIGGGGGGGLCQMFGIMTTANCMTAIVGGVVGHALVSSFGSKLWPFGLGIVRMILRLLTCARPGWLGGQFESLFKNASYGNPADTLASLYIDIRIWTLTLITCCFEGTIFLVNFFWPGVLQNAHKSATLDEDNSSSSSKSNNSLATSALHIPLSHDIPYGVVFASFMAAMILGALFFNAYFGTKIFKNSGGSSTHELKAPVCLLTGAVLTAGLSLLCLSVTKSEIAQFCTFLVFEVANGVYVPSMAYTRGVVVDDRSRAGLYGLMKIPLFVFVILALGITAGESMHHTQMLI